MMRRSARVQAKQAARLAAAEADAQLALQPGEGSSAQHKAAAAAADETMEDAAAPVMGDEAADVAQPMDVVPAAGVAAIPAEDQDQDAEGGADAAADASQAYRQIGDDTEAEMVDTDGEPKSKRICLTYAMREYRLKRHHMAELDYEAVRNPHSRSYADMQLYQRREVIRKAREVQRERVYREEHAEEITAAREKARQEQKRQLALAAKAAVAAFKPTDVPYQSSGLSPAWKHVLQHLAKPLEDVDSNFFGPSVALRQVLSVSYTCREMRSIVVTDTLSFLATRLRAGHWKEALHAPIQPDTEAASLRHWQILVKDPQALSRAKLQDMARQMKIPVGATKPELITGLLRSINLQFPIPFPAEVCMVIQAEKRTMTCLPLLVDLIKSHSEMYNPLSIFDVRRAITAMYDVHDKEDMRRARKLTKRDPERPSALSWGVRARKLLRQ